MTRVSSTSTRHYLAALLLVVGGLFTFPSQGQSALENSFSTPAIEREIAALEASAETGGTDKAREISLLRQAISQNELSAEANKLTAQYNLALTSSESFDPGANIAPTSALTDNQVASATAETIDSLIIERQLALGAIDNRRSKIEQNLRAERSADGQLLLTELRNRRVTVSQDASELRDNSPQGILQAATIRSLDDRIVMLETRELSRPVRFEQWQEELDYLTAQAKQTADQLDKLQTRNSLLKQNLANDRISNIRSLTEQLVQAGEFIPGYPEEVIQRAQELEHLTSKLGELRSERSVTENTRARLQQRISSLTQQLDLFEFGSTPEFGAALRAQRDQIVGTDDVSNRVFELETALTEARLRQFQLDELQQRQRFDDNNTEDNALTALRTTDKELVDELVVDYARYVQALSQLLAEDRGFVRDSKTYAMLLDEHLLWIPSTNAIGTEHLATIPSALRWLLSPASWKATARTAADQIVRQPLPLLLLLLVASLLLHRRPQLKVALNAMKERVGKVNRDGHSLTFAALAITFLLAAPGPTALYMVSRLVDAPAAFGGALASSLRYGAVMYLLLGLFRQSLRPNGLAELHFRWEPTTLDALRKNLPWFMALFIPALALNLLIDNGGTADIRDGLGRLAFVFATLLLAAFAYKTMSPESGIFQDAKSPSAAPSWTVRYVGFPLLVLLPALVACLSAFGYHYTALQFDAYLLNSLAIVLLGLLTFFLLERGIAINERRLALERIRAKRALALTKSKKQKTANFSEEPLIEESDTAEIDLQTISNQTRELLRVFVGVGIGFALWTLWDGLLPAFQSLSDVHLWGGVRALDGNTISGDVTLWALLLAVATAGLTLLAGRNIPSLLEVTLLSRLTLETGTSYAITSLARYIIVITGSVITLQLLGAEWSKLQWLVAALSVGLGFGLQEIVANFVSGIVLLFERPIRIGDTVTVGDQFGTVSRIRIRATTILDWDRREVIIPNKTFITERLVNWTLTDPITRTILRVGVAYGSDVALTEQLLLKVAEDESLVLTDPPPVAVFMSFGESSLDFELRVFVSGIRDLIPVKHKLNGAIDKAFREHNIEIAFPQRDLHLDSKPIEIQIVNPSEDQQAKRPPPTLD